MGLLAYGVRLLPQIVFVGRNFPDKWDRYLRSLSYALICSIISITLFMTGARFEAEAAPYRAVALIAVVAVAHRTRSPVSGMIAGAILLLLLTWLR